MKIVGEASKERLIAAFLDNLLAFGFTFFLVALVPPTLPALKGVVLIAAFLGYFIVFETIWSRTPGKYFQGLVVRKLDGRPCDWKAALIRGGMRVIEVNPVLLGALPAGIAIISSDLKQRMGDSLAGTLVVSDKLKWKSSDHVSLPAVSEDISTEQL